MFKQFAAAALAISISTGALAGESVTATKFLTYTPEGQKGFITATAGTAAVIANMNRPEQGKCIDAWIGSNSGSGYKTVMDAMKKLPDYHPTAVTLAVLQKQCGPLKFTAATAALQ